MLKRNPSLTEQAKSYIKQRIMNDEFDEGRIPAETTLAEELGVSRTTIRDALSRLELEGTIYRKQGAGTFVNEPGLRIQTRLEEIWTYEGMLRAHGYTPSTRIIGVEEQSPGKDTAAELGIASSQNVLVIEKLFLADDEPVIFVFNCIPTALISTPTPDVDFHQPIFAVLEQLAQQHLSYYVSEIVPLIASRRLTDVLALKPNTALISFEEIGYNQDNQPIIKSTSYFKDDLLRLRLLRREIL